MDWNKISIKVESVETDADNSSSNKRLKLEEGFECVVLKPDITDIDGILDETKWNSAVSGLQSEIDLMDIKYEDDYDSDTVDSLPECKDLGSSAATERDPLLPDECSVCGYGAASGQDLERHINESHSAESKLKCPECNYTARKKRTLQQHKRTKHPKDKILLKCTECEYKTWTKRELLQHQRTEHPKRKLQRGAPRAVATRLYGFGAVASSESATNELLQRSEENVKAEPCSSTANRRVCESLIGINKVDNLLTNEFLCLSFEERYEVVRLGPDRPPDISNECFAKLEWLTASVTTKSFLCFYCLLFGGEITWSKLGLMSTEHLLEKAEQHESTAVHINNAVKFKTFGKTDISKQVPEDKPRSILQHNEAVIKHRHVLSRVIRSIQFCVTRELPLPEEDDSTKSLFNRQVFLGLLEMVQKYDTTVHEHTHNPAQSDYTSEAIQNELIDCMYQIYREQLKQDLEKANFVSVQVEKIQSTTLNPQFAIILRYIKDGVTVERLHSFIEIEKSGRTANGLALAIKKELDPYNLQEKLIAQTFDGSATARGCYGGVQACLKDFFPHAHFIHSYAHSFDKILSETCGIAQPANLFFGGILRFTDFFKYPTRRTRLLKTECDKVDPNAAEMKWESIHDTIKSVYLNQPALCACLETIHDELGWTSECHVGAMMFLDLLEERQFLLFLKFYYHVLNFVDDLDAVFKARKTCGNITLALEDFESKIVNLVELIVQELPDNAQFKSELDEASSIVISEIKERLEASDYLVSFSVVEPAQFKKIRNFLNEHLQVLSSRYPFFQQGKLASELKVLYINKAFEEVADVSALLRVLADNGLCDTFSELLKLVEIALVTPVAAVDNDSSTSTKLREFKINDWYPERLVVFATFNIHWNVMNEIPDFVNRVIDCFAKKEGRQQLLYITS